MRPINEIIVHCTATRPNWWKNRTANQKVREVRRWHVEDRGWRDIGYHYLIDRDGTVVEGRPVGQTGAHVRGHNRGTIGIALFGGYGGANTDAFQDNFTPAQDRALRALIADLEERFPTITKLSGHHEYANKACPCFDVRAWHGAPQRPLKPTPASTSPPRPVKRAPGGFWGWLNRIFNWRKWP